MKIVAIPSGFILWLLTGPLWALEVAGVALPDSVTLEGSSTPLVLNGAGVRKKLFFKIYVGALYLPQKQRDGGAILALRAPKSVRMHFLYKEVSGERLAEGWTDGFRANQTQARFEALQGRLGEFNRMFPTVHKGDVIRLDYMPNQGTQVWINSELKGVVPGDDFQRALLEVWLGERPADAGLKRGMLGHAD